jgi:hypothetical protein
VTPGSAGIPACLALRKEEAGRDAYAPRDWTSPVVYILLAH